MLAFLQKLSAARLNSHNNVPSSVPAEIKQAMQENIDSNKDDLVSAHAYEALFTVFVWDIIK
jgi:hypothetical protein